MTCWEGRRRPPPRSWWAHKNQLSSVDEDEAELLKSVGSAFLFLVIGWFLGATIPALLPIMPKAWTLETGTALFIYASLFVAWQAYGTRLLGAERSQKSV